MKIYYLSFQSWSVGFKVKVDNIYILHAYFHLIRDYQCFTNNHVLLKQIISVIQSCTIVNRHSVNFYLGVKNSNPVG